MYFIIETKEQFEKLPKTGRCFIDVVTLSEDTHPALTTPSIIYYNDFDKGYIIPINHTEGFSIDLASIQELLSSKEKVYLLDKKWHSYFLTYDLINIVDVYYTMLTVNGKVENLSCYTNVHRDFYYKHKYLEGVNAIIPISKHYERCECMFESVLPYINKERDLQWLHSYTEAYKWVEEQGIGINEKVFDKYYEPTWKANSIKDGKIYSKYNLYNLTSRPTNAFNAINFLAFTKDNKSRSAFIPTNDVFVEFDFDGYHLRLIANKIGYELPMDVSIHTYLGQQYFEKKELTQEEYQDSKKITFRQLYNGVEHEFKRIEFFNKVAIFIDDLWDTFQYQKYIELPNGRYLKGGDFNPQKLFNYYVQCLETVNNVEKLLKLKELLKDKRSKVVLVVYDSILVDFSKEDGRGMLDNIRAILQENKYLVKGQLGRNYDFA
jgi:hypothetical protein